MLISLCRGPESNRYESHDSRDFKSLASASSATPAGSWNFHLKYGGGIRNRTGDKGFADLCLTAWLCRHMERKTGLEPATTTLARLCSTTELLPHLATRIRFELTISAVTGRHVRPLHHRAASYLISISITPCFVNNLSASYRH